MSLQYKTRGSSSPQGKPRVYFCCHPLDRERFLEPIAAELLELQNCAVWYETDQEASLDEDRRDALKDMQLFVVPVTARLLSEENRGMEEFGFAWELHIPILPLMQEPGLEGRFDRDERCHQLQFLDPFDRDPTAVPYREKLTQYLNSVLAGDELARRVRAAFNAYVFLSYRKKDRKHAQELMRLIHQNDFCRDVAIWYDEFLVPGEDFNQAIADAMKKSRLFAMAVTPSLLEDPNYVQTTEYPAAREANKLLLPVEMVPTDRERLEEMYRDLPACVDGQDKEALAQVLARRLRRVALGERRDDPAHTYFIGLAYLNGIDVEVDRERGVALITQAAEAGVPEAMEQLADMYRYGRGVEPDRNRGIYWRQQLVELRKREYRQEANWDTFAQLLWAQGLLCEILRDMHIFEEMLSEEQEYEQFAEEYLRNMERQRKNMSPAEKSVWMRRREMLERSLVRSYSLSANLHSNLAHDSHDTEEPSMHLWKAKRLFQRGIKLAQKLQKNQPNAELSSLYNRSCDSLEAIARSERDYEAAEAVQKLAPKNQTNAVLILCKI